MPQEDSEAEYHILIFSKTDGFRHDSIEPGIEAIKKLAEENNVNTVATEDATDFSPENLDRFDTIIFLNTTETVFNDEQRAAFKAYIQNGGGFAGIHSATDTEYDWEWYNKLAGAYFDGHPPVQPAILDVVHKGHPATRMLPEEWGKTDEWYNFRDFNEDVTLLMTIRDDSYQGSGHTDFHPMSWFHEYDGGRAFYTGLGHTIESYSDELFLQHIWGGIEYSMGISN
ncbi:MAG: ThuA domain-containing protein [Balneolales bacterium]